MPERSLMICLSVMASRNDRPKKPTEGGFRADTARKKAPRLVEETSGDGNDGKRIGEVRSTKSGKGERASNTARQPCSSTPSLATVMVQEVAFRARSSVNLPRSRSVERLHKVGTLSRVASVPCVHTYRVSNDTYRGSTMHKYRRDYDIMEAWENDRMNHYVPFFFPTYRFQARRSLYVDPIPNSLGFEYPGFWGRYKWYSDWLNPVHWRKHRDPNYDRPLWNNWRPWQMDNVNVKQAIDMYRKGLIGFDTLDKKWIEPTALGRKGKDWFDVYTPAARYGAHRYFYSHDVY